jgi:hypothetical protein
MIKTRPSNQNFDIGADEVGGCFVRVNDIPVTYGNVMVAIRTLPPTSSPAMWSSGRNLPGVSQLWMAARPLPDCVPDPIAYSPGRLQ